MVEKCCCGCCTVATGTAIIAVLGIIGNILAVVQKVFEAIVVITTPDKVPEKHYPEFLKYRTAFITYIIIGILMSFVSLTLSGLLLHGYRTKDYKFCMPWLYWNYIYLILVGTAGVGFCILSALNGELAMGLVSIFIFGLGIAIAAYFVFVVKRFVTELKGDVYSAVNRG